MSKIEKAIEAWTQAVYHGKLAITAEMRPVAVMDLDGLVEATDALMDAIRKRHGLTAWPLPLLDKLRQQGLYYQRLNQIMPYDEFLELRSAADGGVNQWKAEQASRCKRGAPARNKARNAWIVRQRRTGKKLNQILTELQEQCATKGWEPVSSVQAIQSIVEKHNFKSNRDGI